MDHIFTGNLKISSTKNIIDAAHINWMLVETPRQNEENLYVYDGHFKGLTVEIDVTSEGRIDQIMTVSAEDEDGRIFNAENMDLRFHGHADSSSE